MPATLPLHTAAPPLGARQIGRRVFAGDLLLFSDMPAMCRLLSQVRGIVKECFAVDYPPLSHRRHSPDAFLQHAAQAQKRVNSAECKPLFGEVLAEIGLSPQGLFWDTFGLRVAPPTTHSGGFRSHARVHRDSWGAGFQAQINWWTPLWPLASRRTMGFYPAYWRHALPNTTPEWSFKKFTQSRKQSAGGRAAAYPSAPQALAKPGQTAVPLLIKPSQLLCFSSSHLHGSITNTTALTRFSLEIRTLCLDDLRRLRGAPNVDNSSVREPLCGLFTAVTDNSPLKTYWHPPPATAAVSV